MILLSLSLFLSVRNGLMPAWRNPSYWEPDLHTNPTWVAYSIKMVLGVSITLVCIHVNGLLTPTTFVWNAAHTAQLHMLKDYSITGLGTFVYPSPPQHVDNPLIA
jgi:hypothetical protein